MDRSLPRSRSLVEKNRRAKMNEALDDLRGVLAAEYKENEQISSMSRVNLIRLATDHIEKLRASATNLPATNAPQLTGSSPGVIKYISSGGRVCREPPRLIPIRASRKTCLELPQVIPSVESVPADSLENPPVDPPRQDSSDVWRPW